MSSDTTDAISSSVPDDSASGDATSETDTTVAEASPGESDAPREDDAPAEDSEMEDSRGEAPSASSSLTDAQKRRIGLRLRRLVRGEETGRRPVEAVGARGGAPVYGVIIRCDDADALREAGIPLSTVFETGITARLTVAQILEAATIEEVETIRAATKQKLQREPSERERQVPDGEGRR